MRDQVVPEESESVSEERYSASFSLHTSSAQHQTNNQCTADVLVLPDDALLLRVVLFVKLVDVSLGLGDCLGTLFLRLFIALGNLFGLVFTPLSVDGKRS
jgi:hypothetical protein